MAPSFHQASLELAAAHPIVAGLVERHGRLRLGPRPPAAERFVTLARSIAFQQLAGTAARTIWGRVEAALDHSVTPDAILSADPQRLRAAGLSAAKLAALTDLAAHAADGRLQLESLGRCTDEAVIDQLVQVRGVGEWTAHMFLLFTLRRLDVWPTGDLGVRKGFALAAGLTELPSAKELGEIGEPFAPYRSVLAWYCWREADTVTPGR